MIPCFVLGEAAIRRRTPHLSANQVIDDSGRREKSAVEIATAVTMLKRVGRLKVRLTVKAFALQAQVSEIGRNGLQADTTHLVPPELHVYVRKLAGNLARLDVGML